jgi:hypothetical protein
MAGHQHESSLVKDTGISKLNLNLYELKTLHQNEEIMPTVVSSEKKCKNCKLVILHQNICSLRKKNNRIGSAVKFGVKACRINMSHRTLAE